MINVHPHLVHFPVALTLVLFFYECWWRWKKENGIPSPRGFLLALALLGAAGAVATGLLFEKFIPHPHEGIVDQIMERHEWLGYCILAGIALLNLFHYLERRKKIFGRVYHWLLILMTAAVGYQGYLGGELGHTYGLSLPAGEHPPSHLKQQEEGHHHK